MTFDGDEVSFTLSSNSSCQHGLTASRRPEEQNALWRPDPNFREDLGLLDGPFDRFLKSLLDIRQSANVSPVDGGHFDVDLAHGARCHIPAGAHGGAQVHLPLLTRPTGDCVL